MSGGVIFNLNCATVARLRLDSWAVNYTAARSACSEYLMKITRKTSKNDIRLQPLRLRPWRAERASTDLFVSVSTWIMQQNLPQALLCLKAASESLNQYVTAVRQHERGNKHDENKLQINVS